MNSSNAGHHGLRPLGWLTLGFRESFSGWQGMLGRQPLFSSISVPIVVRLVTAIGSGLDCRFPFPVRLNMGSALQVVGRDLSP